ncbi:hypothetical protein TrST_g1587 [Triparma strigata]|uniref:RGS domain-containing protein n=1 Tax=Triparma strigata TaxID=1606541 RepID=A0A9W7DYT2_9STRA|nr:hypothetical protein TrST_g1587 [Triparma strigata]
MSFHNNDSEYHPPASSNRRISRRISGARVIPGSSDVPAGSGTPPRRATMNMVGGGSNATPTQQRRSQRSSIAAMSLGSFRERRSSGRKESAKDEDDFGFYGKVKEQKMDHDDILNTEVFGVRRSSVDLRKASAELLKAAAAAPKGPFKESEGEEDQSESQDASTSNLPEEEGADPTLTLSATYVAAQDPQKTKRYTQAKPGVPSLRTIRKTPNNSRSADVFGGKRLKKTSKIAEISMRSMGTQSGTPRLDTLDAPLNEDESKSAVEEGKTRSIRKTRDLRKSKSNSSASRLTLFAENGAPADEEASEMDVVASGILKDLNDQRSKSPSPVPTPKAENRRESRIPTMLDKAIKIDAGAFRGSGGAYAEEDDEYFDEDDEEDAVIIDSEMRQEDIEFEKAGTMFQGLGDAVVATEWQSSWHVGWKIRGRLLLKTPWFNFMVGLTTMYAIIGMEIAEASVGSRDYFGLHFCSLLSFLFFTFEIIMSSLVIEHYSFSFFFWLDMIGTISLLPDIAFIWPNAWALDGLALARAGRVARTGTRAVRIVRFFRIVRILRLFRVVKLLSRGRKSVEEEEAEEAAKGGANAELNAYRSRLAKRHAAVVEMRVVTGVIMMLIVMPNLEYVYDFNRYMPLEMIQTMMNLNGKNTTISGAFDTYTASEPTLVYAEAGSFSYSKPGGAIRDENIIVTGVDISNLLFQDVTAHYDLTQEIKDMAVLNMLMTMFLAFLFALGSFIFNNDAHELMFQPIARLTEVTSKVSSQLFSINADSINGSESSYIESVLTKIARFFDTEMHKVTTLYTPDNAVWTIDVRREKEEIARVVGSTHRITTGDLHNMRSGSRKEVVQRLMFADFLNDPLAVRYFHTYLASTNDDVLSSRSLDEDDEGSYNEDNLLFWEEIRRYRRAMSSATFQARRIFKTYVHPESENALDFSESMCQALYDEIFLNATPVIDTFDSAEQDAIEIMRMKYFPKFLESDVCNGLVIAKKGLPKAIMVENEYGEQELEEMEEMLGQSNVMELNMAMIKRKSKRKHGPAGVAPGAGKAKPGGGINIPLSPERLKELAAQRAKQRNISIADSNNKVVLQKSNV